MWHTLVVLSPDDWEFEHRIGNNYVAVDRRWMYEPIECRCLDGKHYLTALGYTSHAWPTNLLDMCDRRGGDTIVIQCDDIREIYRVATAALNSKQVHL